MKWLLVFALIALAGSSFLGLRLYRVHEARVPVEYVYSGKVLMDAAEYGEFKQVVARTEVRIAEMSVYSSDDPLVVFKVAVPADVEFRWGERVAIAWEYDVLEYSRALLWFGVLATGVVGFVFLWNAAWRWLGAG